MLYLTTPCGPNKILVSFQMSNEECANDVQDQTSSIEKLQKWNVVDLKSWLKENDMKVSGKKEVLVKRVYHGMQDLADSDSDTELFDRSETIISTENCFSNLNDESWQLFLVINYQKYQLRILTTTTCFKRIHYQERGQDFSVI